MKSRHDTRGTTFAVLALLTSILLIAFAVGMAGWGFAFPLYGKEHRFLSILTIVADVSYVISVLASLTSGVCGVMWFLFWVASSYYRFQSRLIAVAHWSCLVSLFAWLVVSALTVALFVTSLVTKSRVYYAFIGALVALFFNIVAWMVLRKARIHSEASEHGLLGE